MDGMGIVLDVTWRICTQPQRWTFENYPTTMLWESSLDEYKHL